MHVCVERRRERGRNARAEKKQSQLRPALGLRVNLSRTFEYGPMSGMKKMTKVVWQAQPRLQTNNAFMQM